MTVLADLRKLNEERSEGPWTARGGSVPADDEWWVDGCTQTGYDGEISRVDAEFIAAAANHLGDLLDVADALAAVAAFLPPLHAEAARRALSPLLVPQETTT